MCPNILCNSGLIALMCMVLSCTWAQGDNSNGFKSERFGMASVLDANLLKVKKYMTIETPDNCLQNCQSLPRRMYYHDNMLHSHGIESKVIKELSRKFNLFNATKLRPRHRPDIIIDVLCNNKFAMAEWRPLPAIDSDTTVWCVSRAGMWPKWMNFLRIFQSINVMLLAMLNYYLVVIVTYIIGWDEKWTNCNAYRCMQWVLQGVLNQPVAISPKKTLNRIINISAIILSVICYTTFIALYMRNIHRDYSYHQVQTTAELIDGDFRVAAGNADVYSSMLDANIVSIRS